MKLLIWILVPLFLMGTLMGTQTSFGEIHFKTKNIDKNFYSVLIMSQIMGQGYSPQMIKKWDIYVHDVTKADPEFYNHVKLQEGQRINTDMPSGVTSENRVDLYLIDSDGLLQRRENAHVIQHEMAHAILYDLYGSYGGLWVDLVHDNQKTFKMNILFNGKKQLEMNVIDIRPYLKKMQLA